MELFVGLLSQVFIPLIFVSALPVFFIAIIFFIVRLTTRKSSSKRAWPILAIPVAAYVGVLVLWGIVNLLYGAFGPDPDEAPPDAVEISFPVEEAPRP